MSPLKPVLRWPGGKARLAEWILSRIQPHTLYVETCCGGAAVFWAKPKDPKITEVLNDADGELINFYHQLHRRGKCLAIEVDAMPYSRKLFSAMLHARSTRSFRRAVRFWYLNRVAFGAKRDRPTYGVTTRHATVLPDSILLNLDATIERLRGVAFESVDVVRAVELYDRQNALLYVDPPYYGLSQDYAATFGEADHSRLAAALRRVKGQWLLSYNDCPHIRALYADYTIHRRDIRYSLRNAKGCGRGSDGKSLARKLSGELLIGNR